MKIGLSFGRCLDDIRRGIVKYDDVYCIISSTRCQSRDDLVKMTESYFGTDQDMYNLAYKLWDSGRLHQPRNFTKGWTNGLNTAIVGVWLELVPTALHGHPTVARAWENYQLTLKLAQDTVDIRRTIL